MCALVWSCIFIFLYTYSLFSACFEYSAVWLFIYQMLIMHMYKCICWFICLYIEITLYKDLCIYMYVSWFVNYSVCFDPNMFLCLCICPSICLHIFLLLCQLTFVFPHVCRHICVFGINVCVCLCMCVIEFVRMCPWVCLCKTMCPYVYLYMCLLVYICATLYS